MNRDYEIFVDNKDNLPELVDTVFNLYKPFIYKKAKTYSFSYFKNRVEFEDFVSDVYQELYVALARIKDEKIKDKEKFNFFVFVRQSVLRIKDRCLKIVSNELCFNFEDQEEDSKKVSYYLNLESRYRVSQTIHEFDNYLSNLTLRQRIIVKDRLNGTHETKTLAKLHISHGLYNLEMKRAKSLFKEFI